MTDILAKYDGLTAESEQNQSFHSHLNNIFHLNGYEMTYSARLKG